MPKQEGQKSKLLALLHIFEQQTDEEHLLNVPQLVELLARQGILCERKSVYSDIDALNALGYDIRLRRGRRRRGFVYGSVETRQKNNKYQKLPNDKSKHFLTKRHGFSPFDRANRLQ